MPDGEQWDESIDTMPPTDFGMVPFDPMCGRTAEDLEYLDNYREEGESRTDYVLSEEGTLNPENLHFLCDECYIKAGMPSSPTGWKCP